MTTKIKIELTQEHRPIVVTMQSGPERLPTQEIVLVKKGDVCEGYVHSAQYFLIREMSTAEEHIHGINQSN